VGADRGIPDHDRNYDDGDCIADVHSISRIVSIMPEAGPNISFAPN
jgi:hypothetical protein